MANSLDGLEAMKAVIARVTANLPQRAAAALYQEAEAIMAEAKPLTPVDTGALRGSGYVAPPETGADQRISVELGFGGSAADYSVYVHEDLTKRHAEGTGAKFLENPLKEAAPGLAGRIAQRIDLSTL